VKRSSIFFALLLLSVLTAGLSACGGPSGAAHAELSLAPESALPDFLSEAPAQVKEAYRFAAANPDVVRVFPCYCGCGAMGHRSNLDCYIKEVRADGSVEYDEHAFGCSICVDITRDVMRLMREGQDLKSIRTYIDAEYSQYGPSTDTEPIP
jgi:hypothetical protein